VEAVYLSNLIGALLYLDFAHESQMEVHALLVGFNLCQWFVTVKEFLSGIYFAFDVGFFDLFLIKMKYKE